MLTLWCLDGIKAEENDFVENMWHNVNNHLLDLSYANNRVQIDKEECSDLTDIVIAFVIDCLEWALTIEAEDYYNEFYSPVRRDSTITQHFDKIKKKIQTIKISTINHHRDVEIKEWLSAYLANNTYYTNEKYEWEELEDDDIELNLQIRDDDTDSLKFEVDPLSWAQFFGKKIDSKFKDDKALASYVKKVRTKYDTFMKGENPKRTTFLRDYVFIDSPQSFNKNLFTTKAVQMLLQDNNFTKKIVNSAKK